MATTRKSTKSATGTKKTSPSSSKTLSPNKQKLSEMYQRYILDCIIDAAFAVSHDFALRPEVYKDINTSTELISLRRLTGFSAEFPTKETRILELYAPFFGKYIYESPLSDDSMFIKTLESLIRAAKAYSENKLDATVASLRTRVRTSARRFRSYLNSIIGSSQIASNSQTEPLFKLAVKILKDDNIKSLFGVNQTLDPKWPLEEQPDSNGATLIQNIFQEPRLKNFFPGATMQMTIDKFVNKQLIGTAGQNAITGILNELDSDDKTIEEVISDLYTWGSELNIL